MITIDGTIVEEDGVSSGRITIEDGRIKSFSRNGEPQNPIGRLLSYGMYKGSRGLPEFIIFPGFVDINCRVEEKLAAYNGGITTIAHPGVYVENGDFETTADMSVFLSGKQLVTFNWRDPGKLREYPDNAAICEIEGVRSAITQTKIHNLKSRIVISTVASLRLVQEAKADGFRISAEVHPLNLYFDSSMLTSENRKSLIASPPIRSPADRQGLLQALKNGEIDILSSGHHPHQILDPAPGVPALDTFGSIVAWLVEEGVSPLMIFRAACKNPARWAGLENIGRFVEGYQADVTVVAFNKPAIDSRQLYTEYGWSPYDLRHLRGSVEMVMIGGSKVVNGKWIADD